MIRRPIGVVAGCLMLFLLANVSRAQTNVYWNIDPSVKTCSMVINPSLTQAQWHTFTRQTGAIVSFKSLAPASTLGKMGFTIALDQGRTPVNQHDPAWINTFVHPGPDCPLGDAISFPELRARLGITDRMDVGAYWTTAPRANYGGVGGEFKYVVLRESGSFPTVAARASASILTGVPDFNLNVYSADLIASRAFAIVTPYVGFRQNWVIGTETTSKVDLARESLRVPQGYAGVACTIGAINVAAEYNASSVNTLAIVAGYRR
jgi:hypothetical protein